MGVGSRVWIKDWIYAITLPGKWNWCKSVTMSPFTVSFISGLV